MASSSSESNRKWIYDVFLNFRGEDTRRNFVSHLYAALSNAGINTFIDSDKLHKGQQLQPELRRAIEGSQISIVVFSENYAESTWCLHELQKIMECHRNIGQVVLPVFYEVDPSDVRKQTGAFGNGFKGHENIHPWIPVVLSRGRRALVEAADLAGWDTRNNRSESEVVKEIVDAVLKKLDITFLSIPDFTVGLESRVQDVLQFLKEHSSTFCTIGIWGMGGSGKTTIAKAIYNRIHRQFADRSFLENIREVGAKRTGQIRLQKQLLSDILKYQVKIRGVAWGTTMIEERLAGIKVLLVLDDVTKFEQLKALCGNRKWLGAGSVIIVTTRDKRLLNELEAHHIYEMKEMDRNESLELFSWHAFKEASPREDFIEVSRYVVAYCGGLPLALEVLGSYLYRRTVVEWKSVLSKLERVPNDQIQEKLRISFDGLKDDMEKDIFLDISCFFIGKDRAYVTEILNGCELHADIGITVLIERSLIKVDKNNKLAMHDLLRDMGREIVRESSPKKPEKRSRLWFHKDVLDVLTKDTGTESVEGLALKLQSTRKCFSTNVFKEMKRLRLLQLDHVQLNGDYEYVSRQLRWVKWQGFPLKYLPHGFFLENLVAFDLKHSNLKLVWKEPQLLEMLKILNLSHSRNLINTPDFSRLPNLEKLILRDCPSLSKVDQSIGDLSNLLLINLKDCKSLTSLPKAVYKSKSLKTLILSGCSGINKLEEDIVEMASLTTLIANNTAIEQVPLSLVRSKSIGYISLCGYEGLARDVFPSLIWSWMSPTMNALSFIHPSLGMSSSLVSTDVQNYLGDLSPMLRSLSKLRSVWVQCESEFQLTEELRRILQEVHDLNLTKLETTSYASQISESEHFLTPLWIGIGSCHQVLNTLIERVSQELTAGWSGDFSLPGDNYPCWLTYTGEEHSVSFKVPQVSDCQMKGMALCVLYSSIPKSNNNQSIFLLGGVGYMHSSTPESMAAKCLVSVLIVNCTRCTIRLYKRDTVMSFDDEDWQGIVSNLGPDDEVKIIVAFGHGLTVKKTAVYLIYGESIDGKMEPTPEPKNNAFIRPAKRMRMC